MNKILVTGATGPFGGGAINFLLNKTDSSNLAVLVRDPQKVKDLGTKGVEIRQGDYNDKASLLKAFSAINKLFFVSGNDIPNRSKQHENVIAAAKESGVKHVVYTSFARKNESETSPIALVVEAHLLTEKLLFESGLTYTILRNNIYMDMLPMYMGDKVLQTQTIFLSAGEGKAAFATRQDMAEASVNILVTEGHENKIYEFSNTESVNYGDIAKILSELSGKEIKFISPEPDVFKAELKKAGVPELYIAISAGFAEAVRQGEFDSPGSDLEKFLGRKPMTIKQFLKITYNL